MNAQLPLEEETSRFVDLAGLRVHYNEAGAGHPVIFIHGSGPGATGWSNFSQNLVHLAESFHVIALDCPGWGKSDTPSAEQSDLVEVVRELMDKLQLEKAALVGNSMGGAVSISFAVRYPGRISHLITMGSPCPVPNVFSETMTTEGLKILFEAYAQPSPENFKKLVEVMCFDPSFATDELAAQRSAAALATPDHLKKFLQPDNFATLLPGFFELGGKIPQISVPTLAIHGRNDRTVHYENSLQLVSMIPNSRLLLLNQCGHWAQLEHSAEFNRSVAEFLQHSYG